MVLRGDQFINTFWEEDGGTRTSSIDPDTGKPGESPEGTTLQGTLFNPYTATGLPQDPTPGAAEHRRRVIADRFPTEPTTPYQRAAQIVGGSIQAGQTTKKSRASGTDWRNPDPRFSELVTSTLSDMEIPTHDIANSPRTFVMEGAQSGSAGAFSLVTPEDLSKQVGRLRRESNTRLSEDELTDLGEYENEEWSRHRLVQAPERPSNLGLMFLETEVTEKAKTAQRQRRDAEMRGEGPSSGETVWNKNWLSDKPQVMEDEPFYAYGAWNALHEHGVFRNPDTGHEVSGYEAIEEATGITYSGDSNNYNYQLSDLHNRGYSESNIHWKDKGATGVASPPIVGEVEVPDGGDYEHDAATDRWLNVDTGIPFKESVKFHTRTSGDPNWGDFSDKPEELGISHPDVIAHELRHAMDPAPKRKNSTTGQKVLSRNPISEGLADAGIDLTSNFEGVHESAASLDPANPSRVRQIQTGGYGTARVHQNAEGDETRHSKWGTKTQEAAYTAARILQSSTDDPNIIRQASPDNWEASETKELSRFVADAHSADPGVRRGLHALGLGNMVSNLAQTDAPEQLTLPGMTAPTDPRMASAQWTQTGFPSEEDAKKFGGSAEDPPTPINTTAKKKKKIPYDPIADMFSIKF